MSGGVLPDLRHSSALTNDLWFQVVLRGLLESQGMVSFSSELSRDDAAAIRSYVIFRRNQKTRRKQSEKPFQHGHVSEARDGAHP